MFNISNDFYILLSQRDQAKATYDNCLRDQGPLNTETFTAKAALAEIYYSLANLYRENNDTLFLNGLQYLSGLGFQQNFVKARDFFEMAAIQGHTHAQTNLGCMYITDQAGNFSENTRETDAIGVHWLQRAAEQRFAHAQYILGAR